MLLSFFLIGIWVLITLEIFNNQTTKFQLNGKNLSNTLRSNITNSLSDKKNIKRLVDKGKIKQNQLKKTKTLKKDNVEIKEDEENSKKIKVISQNSKVTKKKLKKNKLNTSKNQNLNETKVDKTKQNAKDLKKQNKQNPVKVIEAKENGKNNLKKTAIQDKNKKKLATTKQTKNKIIKDEKKLKSNKKQSSSSTKVKNSENNTIKKETNANIKKTQISTIKFSDDGKFLAVGRENGKLELWNGKDKKFLFYLGDKQTKHHKKINALAFSSDNKFLLSGGEDCQLIKWDIENKKAFRVEKVQLPIFSVAISQTANYFLAGTKNNAYFFIKNQSQPDLINHYGNVKSIAILSSKNIIFTCPAEFNHRRIKPKLKVWKVPPTWPVYKYKFSGEFVISEEKNILLAWKGKKISLYNLNKRSWNYSFLTLDKSIKKVVFLKDNNFFLVVSKENDFTCYNLESKKIVHQFKHPGNKDKLVFAVNPTTNEAVIANKQGSTSSKSLKLNKN